MNEDETGGSDIWDDESGDGETSTNETENTEIGNTETEDTETGDTETENGETTANEVRDTGTRNTGANTGTRNTKAENGGSGDAHLYRVLATPEAGRLRLLDRETYEPIVTAASGHGASVEELRPGYLIDADLDWSSAEPTVESLSVERPTLYAFADGIDPVFEAARDAWSDARAVGDAMNSQVTRNTDNEVNGVLYVFAEDERGTFEAFREGARPLEPLVDRVNENEEPAPREVFVLRPADGQFVVVTIALRKGGQFADTLRETYDRPRPPEPKV